MKEMPEPQSMSDVIVLIPGILGSVLVKDGREVWGASGSSIVGNLITFGKALGDLALPQGVGHGDPKDGVTAPRSLPRLYMVPTFWKADGYGRLVERLNDRFTLTHATYEQPGNLFEFPYDWRLSNQCNAQRLSQTVIPVLERWRGATKNPNAKLIFISHSMGGLVARYFLEVLGGARTHEQADHDRHPLSGFDQCAECSGQWIVSGTWTDWFFRRQTRAQLSFGPSAPADL